MIRILLLALLWPLACAAGIERVDGQIPPWRDVLDRAAHEARPAEWSEIIAAVAAQSPRVRLDTINRRVNAARFVEATDNRWETPAELFSRGGACRGYAVAKFLLLRAVGVPDEDLRLEEIWDGDSRQWHAVVDVRVGPEWLMLDSRSGAVRPRAAAKAYHGILLMNERSWWYRRGEVM